MKETNGENEKQFFDYDEFLAAKEGDEPITFPLPLITRPQTEDISLALEQGREPAAEEEEESSLAKQLKAVLKQHGLVGEEKILVTPPDNLENVESAAEASPPPESSSDKETADAVNAPMESENTAEEKLDSSGETHGDDQSEASAQEENSGAQTQYMSKRAKKAAKRRERKKMTESPSSSDGDKSPSDQNSEGSADNSEGSSHTLAEESLFAAFENPGEDMGEQDSEDSAPETAVQSISQRSLKRKTYFTIGIAVCFLSLVGLFFCGGAFFGWVGNIINNTAQKEEFKSFLYPIIITDPPAAESVTHLPTDTLVSAAIWDIILNGDIEKYPSEFGNITVPQVDVEIHANKLFGPDARLQHKTIGDPSLAFYYNGDTNSYLIPSEPQYFAYSPYVENIRREGDIYHLKVGYISPHPDWMEVPVDKKGNPLADKYMEYTLMKTGNAYIVVSIKETPGGVGDGGVNSVDSGA